tara:strand:+ start:659 stop:1285 length:627 start_codon:yes stop_codon:yes gene_type:complete
MIETVILDFETSGLNQYHDDIIEIGAKVANKDNNFSVLLKPKSNEMISPEITTLTGITNRMLATQGLQWEVAYSKFSEWLLTVIQNSDNKTIAIVSHNGESFDFIFLKRIFSDLKSLNVKTPNLKNIIFIDTLLFSKRLIPGRASYRQGSLCKSFNIIAKGSHRAYNDVLALEQLYFALSDKLNQVLDSRRNVIEYPQMINDYIHFKK